MTDKFEINGLAEVAQKLTELKTLVWTQRNDSDGMETQLVRLRLKSVGTEAEPAYELELRQDGAPSRVILTGPHVTVLADYLKFKK